MRASRMGVALFALLGSASYLGAIAPAEARTDQRHGARSQVAAVAPRATAQAAARQERHTSDLSSSSVRLRSAVLIAPQRDTASRGEATGRRAATWGGGGISCVPYARQITGMAITGNGREWWHNAAGLYARGNEPEVGSVLAFPASGGMRLGHVAVVSRVLSAREVLVDHANWAGPGIRRGTVMRGVSVIDVSPDNDWTQVRVQVGWTKGSYGRVYPTYGFIYNRPDLTGGTMLAGRSRGGAGIVSAAAAATLGESGRTRAPRRGGTTQRWVELAEQQPATAAGGRTSPHARRHLDLSIRVLEASAAR